uniref:Peptidase M13 C-terminal domain-containing protein n=1 Tax=Caenorhabditis japonica TaxID=281687 RepID=A0A8R1DJK7_CAEJA
MLANMAKLHLRDFGMFEVIYFEHQEIGTTKQLLIKPSEIQLPLPKVEMMELCGWLYYSVGTYIVVGGYTGIFPKLLVQMPAELTLTEASYSQLKSHIPSIDFDRILKNLLHPKFGNWTILKNKLATMKFDAFFGEGNNLEQTIRNASSRKLANYLVFKYLESAYSYITVNKQVVDPRPCDELLVNVLPRASLRVFVQKYFNKENLKLASRMVDETKNTYMEMIHASTWLDESTKTEAIHKVAEMRKMVGYTEEYERKGALDEIFETLPTSSSDSFYTLVTKIQRFRTEQLMDFITSDTLLNPTEPLMVANAFYFSLKNSLNILVPFLDDPLFDAKFPKYVNAAGIGRVLAHEIGHAFDIHGRLANYNGSVVDWWTEKNRIEYEKKTKCLVDQYERYVNPDYGRSMNGTRVLSEMIADIVGTEAAWKTFQKMNLTDELDLYGFEYASFDQLYFQIAALDFCAPRDKSPIWKIFAMEHPTNRFRVNGVFSNLKAFADTFKCPAGSPMNPDTRCELF